MKKTFYVTAALILLLPPLTGKAAAKFSLINFYPATDGFISVEGSRAVDWKWKLGSAFVYEYRPFTLTSGGAASRNIVNNLFIQHFGVAAAVKPFLTVSLDLPVALRFTFIDPDVVATPPSEHHTSLGDLKLQLKGILLDSENAPIGLSVIPFITFPTGNESKFIGNDGLTSGAKIALTSRELFERLTIGTNIGVIARKHVIIRNLNFNEQLGLAVAARLKISKPIAVMVEAETTTPLGDIFGTKDNTPVEARGAIEAKLGESLNVTGGGGVGIIHGAGAPLFDIFTSISYRFKSAIAVNSKAYATPTCKIDGTIFFKFDSFAISESMGQALGKIADQLYYNCRNSMIRLEGYTDNYGNTPYNRQLSERRAAAVKKYLEFHGIEPERIRTIGLGEGKSVNRKVVVIMDDK